jgi:hypothetical protein
MNATLKRPSVDIHVNRLGYSVALHLTLDDNMLNCYLFQQFYQFLNMKYFIIKFDDGFGS